MIFTFAKYFRNIKKKFRTTYKKMIFMLPKKENKGNYVVGVYF